MSHANISVFVPHLGCPNRCSFCDQNIISGSASVPTEDDVKKAIDIAKNSKNYNPNTTELAFFGGSFTGIDRSLMLELLSSGHTAVKMGEICGIRISTRPDLIDDEVLEVLKQHSVTSIELGAQSMCDDVLVANCRGHKACDVKAASELIKKHGFELGLQMMTGLYQSTREKDVYTANEIASLRPDTVRIYPTIILEGTYLARLYKSGEYLPPTLDETVELCAEILTMFNDAGIKVIRTGLHTIDAERYVAGPWHPAFRELCDSKLFLDAIFKLLPGEGEYILYVNPKDISKALGNKRANIEKLSKIGYKVNVKPDENLKVGELTFERMNNSCI